MARKWDPVQPSLPSGMFWVAFAAAVYALVMTLLGSVRYATFHSGADLGLFVQSTARPTWSLPNVYEGGSHYLHHFSPILYLCTPFVWLSQSAIALIALQAVAGALVAPPLYLIARARMDERLAIVAACGALLYPPLVGITFTDFHENGLAPAAILWLFWAVDARRWLLAAIFAALALAIKEDEAFVIAILGLGFFVFSSARGAHRAPGDAERRSFALRAALVSLIVLVAYFALLRPAAGATEPWFALSYFDANRTDVQHGLAAVAGRASYLLETLGPLLFVPLASPAFFFTVPGLIETLSSRWSITYTMGQHYAGVWVGEMLFAYVFALGRLAASSPLRARRLSYASVAVCAVWLAVASPTHWAHYLRAPNSHDAALERAIALIPRGSSVGAYDEVYAHLGFHPRARNGYDGYLGYLIVDEAYTSVAMRGPYRKQLDGQLATRRWQRSCVSPEICVYHSTPPAARALF